MNAQARVDVTVEAHIATIRFSHPGGHYMIAETVDALHTAFSKLEQRSDVRVIILANPTPGVFITHYSLEEIQRVTFPTLGLRTFLGPLFLLAVRVTMKLSRFLIRFDARRPLGGMLNRLAKGTPLEGGLIYARANRFLQQVRNSRKPVIAAVSGNAQGYGMELSLACDFRLMARGPGDNTRSDDPENNKYHLGQIESLVGLIPGSGGMHSLTRLIGEAKALELSMLGTRLQADEAEQLGLVYKAVDEDQLQAECHALATRLARRSPLALRYIKFCVHRGQTMSFGNALKMDAPRFMDTACSQPARDAYRWQIEALGQGKTVNKAFEEHELVDLN